MKPVFGRDNISPLFETKFIKLFDINYAGDKHYFEATRHNIDDLTCIKSDDEFKRMIPDAVSCFVVIKEKDKEPKLLLSYEFRYATGQYLLSPPAGLIDDEDKDCESPEIQAAIREIKEETGLDVKPTDKVRTVSPLSFSTPGMTDESNALVYAEIEVENLDALDQSGAVGSELFDGFKFVTKAEAREILKAGRDEHGNFFSIFTWAALMYFVSGIYDED